jgi:NitT/TauT family transport system substrate-binding protein
MLQTVLACGEKSTLVNQRTRGRMRCAGIFASIALLVVGLTACTGPAPIPTPTAIVSPTGPAAAASTTVRAGVVGSLGEAGQYLAESQGYFRDEGLAIEFTKADPSTVFTALMAGGVDVAGFGIDPGLFRAVQQGMDFRIVATQASSEPNANGAFLVARKDLIDAGRIRSNADLKGLKIAIPALGTSAEYVVARAMEGSGLTISDADPTVLSFPATLTALGTGAIDIGYLPDPLATVAVENGSGVKWRGVSDIVPGFQIAVVVFSPQFAAQRDLATRWMTAYLRGIRDYNDAFVKNANRPRAVETLADALSVKPTLFDSIGFAHIDPDGKVNIASIEDLTRWYVNMGYLSSPVDVARVVDPTFTEAAVAKLGPYH